MTNHRPLDETDQYDDETRPSRIAEAGVESDSRVLTSDPATATISQLLAMMLGPATRPVCRRIVAEHVSLRQIARLFPAELRQYGCNRTHIEKLAALFELAKRFGEEEWLPGVPFRGSYDVYAHYRERLPSEPREHFIAVALDNKNRKLRDIVVAVGSLTSCVVAPREVYLPLIRESAAAVIFCHQHFSGDPTPSREDIEITRRLREVGELVGIRVLDHVVIGRGRYVSFCDDGYW